MNHDEMDSDLLSRLRGEIDSWHGTRPWASQAAFRLASRRSIGSRAWISGFAVAGALVLGGVGAAAATGGGFTVPGTGIHLSLPATSHATSNDGRADSHGKVPAGKTPTDKDGHGDLTSAQHSQAGEHSQGQGGGIPGGPASPSADNDPGASGSHPSPNPHSQAGGHH